MTVVMQYVSLLQDGIGIDYNVGCAVDAVTSVTNIPAIVTEVKCTNVAIARVLVCTRCMSCKAYNMMKACNY